MKYIQYQGSPNVFDKATGKWISATEAAKIPNFRSQVEVSTSVRPGVKTAADFSIYNEHDIGWTPPTQGQQSPTGPLGSPSNPIHEPYKREETPPKTEQKPGDYTEAGKTKLIQFTNNPNVYDISGGTLKYIDADTFARMGYNFSNVTRVDASTVGMAKDASGNISVNLMGTDVKVPDWNTFENSGLSRTVLQGEKQENWIQDFLTEIKTGSNLEMIRANDPALTAMFNSDGSGKGSAAGSTLMQWATTIGWKDSKYATQLEAYRPENFVRASYLDLHGRDPFDPKTFDEGAYHWVNDVKDGGVTSYADYAKQIKEDPAGEFAGMTEAEKAAAITYSTLSEEDLAKYPEFEEFFKSQVDLTKMSEESKAKYKEILDNYLYDKKLTLDRDIEDFNLAKTYYDTQYTNYLKEKGVKEARTIEDTATLLSDLSEDQESELTAEQRALRSKIKNAVEGYGSAGLIRSSFRGEGETGIRQVGAEEKAQTVEAYQRKTDEANLEKTRIIDDLAREQAQKEAEKNRLIAEKQLEKDRNAADLAKEEERKRIENERLQKEDQRKAEEAARAQAMSLYNIAISTPESGIIKKV